MGKVTKGNGRGQRQSTQFQVAARVEVSFVVSNCTWSSFSNGFSTSCHSTSTSSSEKTVSPPLNCNNEHDPPPLTSRALRTYSRASTDHCRLFLGACKVPLLAPREHGAAEQSHPYRHAGYAPAGQQPLPTPLSMRFKSATSLSLLVAGSNPRI